MLWKPSWARYSGAGEACEALCLCIFGHLSGQILERWGAQEALQSCIFGQLSGQMYAEEKRFKISARDSHGKTSKSYLSVNVLDARHGQTLDK